MSSEAGEVYRSSWTGTIRESSPINESGLINESNLINESSLINEGFDWDVDIEHI